jgi:DNA-binding transcriptional MerR regulator
MNEGERSFDLGELSALTGTAVRTIRFYIQEGLMPRPLGLGRGAHYGAEHLETLLAIRRWQNAGLSLERTRKLLAGAETGVPPPAPRPGTVEVWSHLVVRPGVELLIEPGQAELSPEQIRALFRTVLDAVGRLQQNETEEQGK